MTSTVQEQPRLLSEGGLSSLPRVNLLPSEVSEKATMRKVQAGLVGLVALSVAGVGVLYMSAASSVSSAEDNVAAAQAQQASLNSQIAEFAEVAAVYQQAADARLLLTAAMGQEIRYSGFLNDLSLSIPDNVWLTEATFNQVEPPPVPPAAQGATSVPAAVTPTELGIVTMSGVAFEHNDVARWLESLSEQDGYSRAYLTTSIENLIGDRPVVEWTTTVVLNPDALSGRFSTPAGG